MFTSLQLFYTRRNLRNKANILELRNPIFLKNFRLSKEAFVFVLGLLDLPTGIRSTHVPPILQLAATLNLLGGGGCQRQVGADWAAPMGQMKHTSAARNDSVGKEVTFKTLSAANNQSFISDRFTQSREELIFKNDNQKSDNQLSP